MSPIQNKAAANDPLLQSLLALCRIHGEVATPEALTSGLPLRGGCLTPSLFARAAKRVGMASRVVERPFDELDPALLPAVLLEKEGASLLVDWDAERRTARVVHPDISQAVVEVDGDDLRRRSIGKIILCRPEFTFDQAAPSPSHQLQRHWFWHPVKENLPLYRDVLVAAFFINLFGLAVPLFIRTVYDRVLPNHAVETLWVLTVAVVIAFIADFLLRVMRGYFIDLAARRIDVKVSASLMERLLGTRLEYRTPSVGATAVRIRAFERIRDFIASTTVTALVDLPFAMLFLGVIAWLGWQMAIPPVLGIAAILLYVALSQEKMHELSDTVYRASAVRNSSLVEGLVGLETLKAMGAESHVQREWEQSTAYLSTVSLKLRLLTNSAQGFSQMAQHMVSVFGIVVGVYLIARGQLTFGGLIACHILAGRVLAPFYRIAGLLAQYHFSTVAMRSLNELMDKPVERPDDARFISRRSFRGNIEFKNVSFRYPGGDVDVLQNVSFKIDAGEHVAIVGRVGSGKSTIQKLCMGLYQPTSGAILIDGIDLRQLDPQELRSRMGYVPQDVTLFRGTLRDNLTLAHPGARDRDLVRAMDIAGLAEFVDQHPKGFDMAVGERGESLSGGQRHSVALARGIIHRPRMLLLDEPTAAMDKTTQRHVRRKLNAFSRRRTLLLVTHGNTLLRLTPRVIVMEDGRIKADGERDRVLASLQQKVRARQTA